MYDREKKEDQDTYIPENKWDFNFVKYADYKIYMDCLVDCTKGTLNSN